MKNKDRSRNDDDDDRKSSRRSRNDAVDDDDRKSSRRSRNDADDDDDRKSSRGSRNDDDYGRQSKSRSRKDDESKSEEADWSALPEMEINEKLRRIHQNDAKDSQGRPVNFWYAFGIAIVAIIAFVIRVMIRRG